MSAPAHLRGAPAAGLISRPSPAGRPGSPARGIARTDAMMAGGAQLAAHAAYSAAVALVSRRFDVPIAAIDDRSGRYARLPPPRSPEWRTARHEIARAIRARRTALYLSVVGYDRSLRSVARAARLTPEGVRKALAAIEDARDEPDFDAALTDLEKELTQ